MFKYASILWKPSGGGDATTWNDVVAFLNGTLAPIIVYVSGNATIPTGATSYECNGRLIFDADPNEPAGSERTLTIQNGVILRNPRGVRGRLRISVSCNAGQHAIEFDDGESFFLEDGAQVRNTAVGIGVGAAILVSNGQTLEIDVTSATLGKNSIVVGTGSHLLVRARGGAVLSDQGWLQGTDPASTCSIDNDGLTAVPDVSGAFAGVQSLTTVQDAANEAAAATPTWFVDFVNGNDRNPGTTSTEALRTLTEWARRIGMARLRQDIVGTVNVNLLSNDPNTYSIELPPGTTATINFNGVATVNPPANPPYDLQAVVPATATSVGLYTIEDALGANPNLDIEGFSNGLAFCQYAGDPSTISVIGKQIAMGQFQGAWLQAGTPFEPAAAQDVEITTVTRYGGIAISGSAQAQINFADLEFGDPNANTGSVVVDAPHVSFTRCILCSLEVYASAYQVIFDSCALQVGTTGVCARILGHGEAAGWQSFAGTIKVAGGGQFATDNGIVQTGSIDIGDQFRGPGYVEVNNATLGILNYTANGQAIGVMKSSTLFVTGTARVFAQNDIAAPPPYAFTVETGSQVLLDAAANNPFDNGGTQAPTVDSWGIGYSHFSQAGLDAALGATGYQKDTSGTAWVVVRKP